MARRCLREGVNGSGLLERGGGKTYLCNRETWEDRPPKEEAMVLNSTCLI